MSATKKAKIAVKVNIDNFVQAETSFQFDRFIAQAGGSLNTWAHVRQPTPLDEQNVVRMNRDTLYSFAVAECGSSLTMPNPKGRYMSVMVVNQNHYIDHIYSYDKDKKLQGGGNDQCEYKLTIEEFDTPYVVLAARTLADPTNRKDLQDAHALQDLLNIEAPTKTHPYGHEEYDDESYQTTHNLLLELSNGLTDTDRMFGSKDEVDPIRHLLGTAYGWGGLPSTEAYYVTRNEPWTLVKNQVLELSVSQVPVDAFWSISIYNRYGYFEKNEFDSYSINSLTATPNADNDASITIRFGTANPDKDANFLFIMEGWNYVVRFYQPRAEVLNGSWQFPEPTPVAAS